MFAGKNILRRSFALFSLGLVLAAAGLARTKTSGDPAEPAATATVKRQSAAAQFARAEEQQAALNSKPREKRTLADYKQVVTSYRRGGGGLRTRREADALASAARGRSS